MAVILAYGSPALGHFVPVSALLSELIGRGHRVHVRTLSAGAAAGRRLGFAPSPSTRASRRPPVGTGRPATPSRC